CVRTALPCVWPPCLCIPFPLRMLRRSSRAGGSCDGENFDISLILGSDGLSSRRVGPGRMRGGCVFHFFCRSVLCGCRGSLILKDSTRRWGRMCGPLDLFGGKRRKEG
ncbi:hypothetical protein TcCL_Unassigned06871, partial [Trypanosoma cruzi]